MLNPNASFPTQTNSPDADYPQGSAKNVSSPGAGDGTPWVAPVINDIWGFMQKLVAAASITPSGDADNVNDSDVFDALAALFDQSALGTTSVAGLVQLSNNTASTSDSLAATIGALNALRTLLVPSVSGNATDWCIKIGKIKIMGGQRTVNATTVTINFAAAAGGQSAYTGAHLSFSAWINTNSGGGNDDPISSQLINASSGAIRSNSGQNNFTGYLSIGYDA